LGLLGDMEDVKVRSLNVMEVFANSEIS
jgi:hypothetical protein